MKYILLAAVLLIPSVAMAWDDEAEIQRSQWESEREQAQQAHDADEYVERQEREEFEQNILREQRRTNDLLEDQNDHLGITTYDNGFRKTVRGN